MGVALRLATADDAPAITATLAAAFAPLRPQYTPAAYAATVATADAIRARFPAARAWLACMDAQVVGTVTARPTPKGMYVQSMAVVPAARGHGAGRALLEAGFAFAREQGAHRLYLSTTPFLHDAIRLYEAAGLRVVPGEGPFDLHGTPLVTMARPLP